MKRILKRVGAGLAISVVGALALAGHTWFGKPISLNWFYDRAFVKFGVNKPETLTYLGFLEQFGIRGHNAKWDDVSIAAEDEAFVLLKAEHAVFQSYDASNLRTQQDRVSHAVFSAFLRERLAGERWRFHDYPVNQLFGVQSSTPNLMTQQQPLTNRVDAEHYIARLDAIPAKFAQVLEGVRLREQKGIVPPRFAVDKVIDQMKGFIKNGAKGTPLYAVFAEKLQQVDSLSDGQRDDLKARVEQSITQRVIPAYQLLISHFERMQAKVTRSDGAWALPDGEAYYQHQIESHTTTTMTADEIHALGLSEVAGIRTHMEARLAELGLAEGTLAQRMTALSKRPEFVYPNTDAGRMQVLNDYQAIIDEMYRALPAQFGRMPKAKVVVKRVPEFVEKSAPAAYYDAPAIDGSRPGVFFANLRDANETPRFGMRTLAYHEAAPGHHLQVAIAQELKGLPIFRKFSSFTGYSEGWALYAERLAWEMGFQKQAAEDLGRLQDEMLRAVRLVVDTGIHAKRWSRERAIAYMVEHTGMAEDAAVTEIERYFVNPGQALAYKIGMIKILQLRDKAKAALGERYDQRAFHDVVLSNGAVPLTVLEQLIDDDIASKRHPSPA
jgi:uncharacterized protein (DUF885 family)